MSDSEKRKFTDQYLLRLPDGMRDRIKSAAEQNGRSMNAEIVATLEEAYPPALSAKSVDRFITLLADSGSISPDEAANLRSHLVSGGRYVIEVDTDDAGMPSGEVRIGPA